MSVLWAQDIVSAAEELLGIAYRPWQQGQLVPDWWTEYHYELPPLGWIQQRGIMCSDVVNYARQRCGLWFVGGTGDYASWIVDWQEFDPDAPGQPGALCVRAYQGPDDQGHIGVYWDEHYLIQAVPGNGVTWDYTDYQTYEWGPSYEFQWYGRMPDITYS